MGLSALQMLLRGRAVDGAAREVELGQGAFGKEAHLVVHGRNMPYLYRVRIDLNQAALIL